MFQKGQLGLYIHWPFCLFKCPYCDFNSHVRDGINDADWQNAFLKSLDRYAAEVPDRTVRSIFFGGGTPSLMKPHAIEAIIERVQKNWHISNNIEITLEANPTSVEADKFKAFRAAGINRVSLGIQAMNDSDLKFLGRQHSAADALNAIEIARNNFDRYSFDLIYARPDQTLKAWEAELNDALKHTAGHMSLYQLTIERKTPFYAAHARGDFSIPQDDLAADFYDLTQEIMSTAGLPAYEVSNHAAPDQESRHNLTYWHYGDYIGVGAGAHGRLTIDGQKFATREHSTPEAWLSQALGNGNAAKPYERLSNEDQFLEALMMGLRLTTGLSKRNLEDATGCNFDAHIDRAKLDTLIAQNWITETPDHIKLEREGMLRLNAIIPYILKADLDKAAA